MKNEESVFSQDDENKSPVVKNNKGTSRNPLTRRARRALAVGGTVAAAALGGGTLAVVNNGGEPRNPNVPADQDRGSGGEKEWKMDPQNDSEETGYGPGDPVPQHDKPEPLSREYPGGPVIPAPTEAVPVPAGPEPPASEGGPETVDGQKVPRSLAVPGQQEPTQRQEIVNPVHTTIPITPGGSANGNGGTPAFGAHGGTPADS